MNEPLAGLEDVVVTSSAITFIDGDKGILRYRGYDVNELAEKSNYEEVAYLLIFGRLPTAPEFAAFTKELRSYRPVSADFSKLIASLPSTLDPMAWLRTAVSALEAYNQDSTDLSASANLHRTLRLTAQLATITAAIDRIRKGKPAVSPDLTLDHAANFLYMLTGQKPDALSHRAMDIALILQADHELNASTFAGRVTVSTLSDMYSAVTTAVGTLKGPLHGGANQRVMEMLDKIGSVDKVEPFVKQQLAEKKKVMGFGHRVYTNVDPRAAILKHMARELSEKVGPSKWYEMSELMEGMMLREKKLNPNLDFYSATVYRYLAIDVDLFPMIFATSRVVGWCTHFMEQYANNRLIRPLTHYTGPQWLKYDAIDRRKVMPAPVSQ